MSSILRKSGIALCTGALLVGGGASSATAATNQTGLVNLSLDRTTIQVPVAIAANICGVAVNLLSAATAVNGVDCTATGVSEATAEPRGGGGGNTNQTGLVNVAIDRTTVQIPVAVAANICGVGVNVAAAFTLVNDVTCDALAAAEANN